MKYILSLAMVFSLSLPCYAGQTIVAKKVDQAPIIDGQAEAGVWDLAEGITTHDIIADIDIVLKVVYTKGMIFFLVVYPDADESREHKTWVWNKETEMYDRGPQREDMFVFKWSLEEHPIDLSIFSDNDYVADVWFWKAHRTDSVGFADDKVQYLNRIEIPSSKVVLSKLGKSMFLQRKGDEGTAAYKNTLFVDYEGDQVSRFEHRTPDGSRGDIRAKGMWSNGQWTIEFSRMLNTGHSDDVQLNPATIYQFGVSRYEISGRDPDPKLTQPLYGSGDTSENLSLTFEQ